MCGKARQSCAFPLHPGRSQLMSRTYLGKRKMHHASTSPRETCARLAKRLALMASASAMLLTLQACRETERDRPLSFTPHVYQGDKTPTLTEKQKRELTERGNLQR